MQNTNKKTSVFPHGHIDRSGWKNVKLGNICSIKARIGWQGLKKTEYLDYGDYCLVSGTDFKNGFVNWNSCSYVSEWRYKQDKNIQLKDGDVLITKDGTIGKVAYVQEMIMPTTLNSGVFVIRPKENSLMPEFLQLIFKSHFFNDFLDRITAGSTIVHLYQKDIIGFEFPIPQIEEQKHIAKSIRAIDEQIERYIRLINKYNDIKKTTVSLLMKPKEKWKSIRLEDFEAHHNNTCSRALMGDSNGRIRNIHYGDILVKYSELVSVKDNSIDFLSKEGEEHSPKDFLHDGDIVIADTAEDEMAGKVIEMENVEDRLVVAGLHTVFLRPPTHLFVPGWLGYWMNSVYYHNQLLPFMSGIKVLSLSKSNLTQTRVYYPSTEKQREIVKAIKALDMQIIDLRTQLKKANQLKHGMMFYFFED